MCFFLFASSQWNHRSKHRHQTAVRRGILSLAQPPRVPITPAFADALFLHRNAPCYFVVAAKHHHTTITNTTHRFRALLCFRWNFVSSDRLSISFEEPRLRRLSSSCHGMAQHGRIRYGDGNSKSRKSKRYQPQKVSGVKPDVEHSDTAAETVVFAACKGAMKHSNRSRSC